MKAVEFLGMQDEIRSDANRLEHKEREADRASVIMRALAEIRQGTLQKNSARGLQSSGPIMRGPSNLLNHSRQQTSNSNFASGEVRVADLETWSGRILDIEDGFFSAELIPGQPGPELVADFDVDVLGDNLDIAVGDVIYLTVRTVVGRTGNRDKTSSIRLRRLGVWTASELQQVEIDGREEKASWSDLIG